MYIYFRVQSVNHNFLFLSNQAVDRKPEMTILRNLLLKILLLAWAELTVAEFSSDAIFSEVG